VVRRTVGRAGAVVRGACPAGTRVEPRDLSLRPECAENRRAGVPLSPEPVSWSRSGSGLPNAIALPPERVHVDQVEDSHSAPFRRLAGPVMKVADGSGRSPTAVGRPAGQIKFRRRAAVEKAINPVLVTCACLERSAAGDSITA